MSEKQRVIIQPHAEAIIGVICEPRFDDIIVDQMQAEISVAAAKRSAAPVILDMSKVDYVPSIGLGALVGLSRRLRQDGHRFLLAGLQAQVRTLFTITRLDKLFEIRSNVDDALAHLKAGDPAGGSDAGSNAQ
jgi:anti-sigma B factor antagonist